MTQYHFNLLDENQQAQTVREKGVLIGERENKNYRILLYQIDAFYVEAYLHTHFNVIAKFRSFRSLKHLDPYLKEIAIGELIQD